MVKQFFAITAINGEAGKGNNPVIDRKRKKEKNSKHIIYDKEKLLQGKSYVNKEI